MIAAPTYGQIGEFKPERGNILNYLERMQMFFAANNVAEGKQAAVLISSISDETYGVLKNLLASALPGTKSLDELTAALKDHYAPKPSIIAERFHFHRRRQALGESVADFTAEIRRLASTCEFGDYLDDALRDQFVCGLTRSEGMHKRLLAETTLTLKQAVEIATGMEAAAKHAKSFKDSDTEAVKAVYTENCKHCGKTNHKPSDCRFKTVQCNNCGKTGHISRVCRSPRKDSNIKAGKGKFVPKYTRPKSTKYIASDVSMNTKTGDGDEVEELGLFMVSDRGGVQPIWIDVEIEGKTVSMELDTGAAVSIMSSTAWRTLFPRQTLKEADVALRTYTAEKMSVLGQCQVNVKVNGQKKQLVLTIVKGDGPSLLGRDWLKHLQLDWQRIAKVDSTNKLENLLQDYEEIFKEGTGTVNSYQASLHLKEGAYPKYHRARSVPFAIREAVGEELDRLERAGILEKVTYSEWAAPVVAVPKKDGKFRICGDYKVTINSVLETDQYPLPKPEELFATLAGGITFTKLDLSQAYTQIPLDEESVRYVTINTHKGLYRYKRLPYGVASAPAIFQKFMDSTLQGIPNVTCYIDDILVTGSTHAEHLGNLREVFRRLKQRGLRIKKSKCSFMQSSVEYLGHIVDRKGLHANPEKVKAIVDAPCPRDVPELRAFLGLLNYYGKFLPNLAGNIYPLNNLLCKAKKWNWTEACKKSFNWAKQAIASSKILVHYDPKLPIKVAADASAYGIGAVLSHILEDNTEHPVAFASRTLSPSEKNYSQIDKEALALIFAVKKFHQYLYGRHFTLVTDHKPLLAILGPKKGIPPLAAARLQRWAFQLSAYTYDIEFKRTTDHCNADGLSRLPIQQNALEQEVSEITQFNIGQIQALPISSLQIQKATQTDLILSKVYRFIQTGWPTQIPDEDIKPYWLHRSDLTVECNCVMYGIRVVIPRKLQQPILQELHSTHPGIQRMKALARSHIWWPGLDRDIEQLVRACTACQRVKQPPAVAPLHPWIWPARPWQRIHVDFAGPFLGTSFLIVVDAHSKWPEVIEMSSTTAAKTIQVMRHLFSQYGLPQQLVSDNGPQFVSEEFGLFLKQNGVKHIKTAPYHPSSNGLAERFVRTFKEAMKSGERERVYH